MINFIKHQEQQVILGHVILVHPAVVDSLAIEDEFLGFDGNVLHVLDFGFDTLDEVVRAHLIGKFGCV